MMFKFLKLFLNSFLLFSYLCEACDNKQWESSLAELKKELNYKLSSSIEVHNVFEKRIEDLFNQFSEFREEVKFRARIESVDTKINDMKEELNDFKNENQISRARINYLEKNPVPIGFIYTQLPNQAGPRSIWPSLKWVDISEQYSNLFFRVIGNKSKSFGEYQEENSPRLIEVHSHFTRQNGTWTQPETIHANNQWSRDIYSGDDAKGQYTYMNFKVSSGEVRPGNKAIRIWKRVSD